MAKSTKRKQPILFEELVENGFDFLKNAIDEFDTKPKYSVIHFAIATELLLKSRLLHEHWSLIVDGEPDFKRFKEGNFKSINFKDILPRLEQALEENIPTEVKKCFDAIANHRNKMVHFFHEGTTTIDKKIILEVAREQSRGWIYLQKLLTKWTPIFSDFEKNIKRLNLSMKNHYVYLNEYYNSIKPEIIAKKAAGAKYRKCSNCHFESSRQEILSPILNKSHCEVCLLNENLIYIKCPHCDKKIEITDNNHHEFAICPKCENDIVQEELSDLLDTNPTSPDNYFDKSSLNCAECMSTDSVIEHNEFYVCLNCFYIEKGIQYCEWCNEGQIGGGDLTGSGLSGCEFCDGRLGYDSE